MTVKTMGVTLGMAALLGVTSWAGAGSQTAAQGPEEALRPALSDRAVGPASPALVTAAPRPGAASAALATEAPVPRTQEPGPEQRRTVRERYGRLPLSFIENQGQADPRIAYYVQSPGRSLYFTTDGYALRLSQGKGDDAKGHTIKVELVGAAAERIESLERAPGIVSYFKGPQAEWKTAIPTHATISYVQPWPGIDLAYDGLGGRLESIYTVAPHADPAQIRLRYSGHDSLRLDAHGNLVYTTSLGEITETAPILYQEIDGSRVAVEGRFILLDEATVAFEVAHYNPDHALIIDPILAYAGYIGGNRFDEGTGIAVDSAGNAYVTGHTQSTEATFPVTVGPDLTHNGGMVGDSDAFVTKVNPAGTALVYAGYIGGNRDDLGTGIAVDSAGNAYVTGSTASTEASFPVLVGPDLTHNGGIVGDSDAFVAKITDVAIIDLQGSVAVGGAPVVGAKVKLKNLATLVVTKTTTDAAGAYQFDPVASGSYKITIGTFEVGAPSTVSGNLTVKGAPSVGTKLKLKNLDTGVVRKTTTDASGNFSFAGAAPGIHKIAIPTVPVP
jgi:hypothetical protein